MSPRTPHNLYYSRYHYELCGAEDILKNQLKLCLEHYNITITTYLAQSYIIKLKHSLEIHSTFAP